MRIPPKRTAVIIVSALAIVIVARCVWAFTVVHSVASTVKRSVEIGFGPVGQPDRIGHWVSDHIDLPAWLHRGTFDVALRPVTEFEVWYFAGLRGDLGAEIRRFSGLRRVTIIVDYGPTESDWTLICTRLKTLPRLEELWIGSPDLTERGLQPLVGHPRLRTIVIAKGRFDADAEKRIAASFPNAKIEFP